jgi:VanZ family protein
MNVFFSVLSAAYITGIFLFADSPMVSDVAPFNPYSLLHIPLYGVLTVLLILSNWPTIFIRSSAVNSRNLRNLLVSGSIAFVLAIADEIHQAYIPNRNASVMDVLLDLGGIICCILVMRRV